jgi:predicted metal-dependent peptidase
VLLATGLKFAPGFTPITAEGLKLPPGLTAEEYYDLLTPQQTQKRRQQAQDEADAAAGTDPGTSKPMPGCGGDCGSAVGNPQGWEETAEADSGVDGQTESDQRTMRQEVAQKVREYVAANGCGSVPAGLEIWSTVELTPPVVKWTSVLASMVRNAVASRSGADDYNLGRISRRSIGLFATLGCRAPILPALRAPQPSVAVVLDTSGSMDGAPVRKGASEVYGVVRALGLPVRAYAVDAAVQIAVSIWSKADVTKLGVGGGGTDMALGIREAAKGRPDVIVIITDAGTPWPAKRDLPKAKLIVVVIGSKAAAATVPEYMGARVIRVPVEE